MKRSLSRIFEDVRKIRHPNRGATPVFHLSDRRRIEPWFSAGWKAKGFFLVGAGMEVCFLGLCLLGDLRFHVGTFLTVFLLAFLLYLSALVRIRRPKSRSVPGPSLILAVAFLFRATILFAPPSLSDDVYRYLWEGNLVLHGENPFEHPPEAPELVPFRDPDFKRINHPEVSTIYPPVAQGVFAVSRAISRHPLSMKAAAALADLALVFLLLRVLAARGRDPRLVLVYAWHPLPVLEFAGSGHIDVVAVLFLVLSLHLLVAGRFGWSSLALSFSFLTKPFACALLPFYWFRVPRARFLAIFLACILLCFLPFLGAGPSLLRGGLAYAARWRFNGSAFDLLVWATGSVPASKMIVGAIFAAAAVWLAPRAEDPFRVGFTLTGLYVLLSPTVHPWYATWFLPFLCLEPRASWIYLSGAVVLSYQVLGGWAAQGHWIEAPWVRIVEYVPFFLLLAVETTGCVLRGNASDRTGFPPS
jgi:alpha-1,6-mannosyltransferase